MGKERGDCNSLDKKDLLRTDSEATEKDLVLCGQEIGAGFYYAGAAPL